jgi:putative ATP-binding cassette transporter
VLDEATSALDLRAEAELLETLRRNLPDTALLVIAHRDPAALGKRRIVDLGVPEPLARTA